MTNTIRIGVFPNKPQADKAIALLRGASVPDDALSVICPACDDDIDGVDQQDPAGAKALEGAVKGGAAGALAGLLAAAAAIPATAGASLLVAGPIFGAAVTGAAAGGFIGAMMTRGFDPAIADYYDQALQAGKVLVAVESEDKDTLERAERALEMAGAEPMELKAEL